LFVLTLQFAPVFSANKLLKHLQSMTGLVVVYTVLAGPTAGTATKNACRWQIKKAI
jgi:hypothetical protein